MNRLSDGRLDDRWTFFMYDSKTNQIKKLPGFIDVVSEVVVREIGLGNEPLINHP